MNKPTPEIPAKATCSYCRTVFTVTNLNWMPFCSRRCKEVDLSNWLTENYGLPFEGDPTEEDAARHKFFQDDD